MGDLTTDAAFVPAMVVMQLNDNSKVLCCFDEVD